MNIKILIMFPYSGYKADEQESNSDCGKMFWELIENCRNYSEYKPIIVVNRDTIEKGGADRFFQEHESYKNRYGQTLVEIIKVWSVDTCQMWLHGWGKIIDDNKELQKDKKIERIIQLPGDIERISDRKDFYTQLGEFCSADYDIYNQCCYDIVAGDFKTREFSGKSLIDSYGTFPLLANWFPKISKAIFSLPLYKPRTEFLNLRVDTLKELLINNRKFPYEQTLNFLIHSWDNTIREWKYNIKPFHLGYIEDYSGYRQYQGCLDQVERTERMLKLLWRETHAPKTTENEQEFKKFMDNYDFLCQRSQAICETARITIRSLLGLGI